MVPPRQEQFQQDIGAELGAESTQQLEWTDENPEPRFGPRSRCGLHRSNVHT